MNFDVTVPVQSLYIHWPFCPYKCYYCPFVALAGHDHFMERYHEVLGKEITDFAQQQTQKAVINTLFFGGGTPSTYPLDLLLDMRAILNKNFTIAPDAEITFEVNPGTVTLEKLAVWKEVGINRLSIGVQSLNNEVLKKLNRHQNADDVRFLLDNAPQIIENLSVDVILGLPGVDEAEWKELINALVTWPIKHVSMYFLTVHEDTPLYFGIKQNKFILPCEDSVIDLYYWTVERLAQAGIYQYEVSNFARPGYQSRHNTVYWQRKIYKGFGMGACSFDGNARLQNEKNLLKYLEGVEKQQPITCFYEQLTEKQAWLETLMLGLRQASGISVKHVMEHLSPEQQQEMRTTFTLLSEQQLLAPSDDEHIRLTTRGLAVVNEITLKLSEIY
ncbi:radical SAM family heme chaperone HemW [Candidatus Dependentiae bacterium]|nr:radical SAM family heme chaperone HemW [Candidatus Dependentiae bacterium]